ncbi:hypothetical protein [Mycolicibacterium sp.]|uniref:hypothetical protein n=1 Tax=Mycolicibacterium sp. TaxID=2320850 RepID=UPI00356028AC
MSDVQTVYTDDYGDVTEEQWRLYRERNVSPSDHDELLEVYGRDESAREQIVAAVREFTRDGGSYSSYHMVQAAQRSGKLR